MAFSSLWTLLDDITSVLDDVAMMTKTAAKNTAGVLGDDLALNAQQVSGVHADRELPVVWAVAKGSAINKAILVPLALIISALFPKLITPLLMLGGAYLCFEGVEKLAHKWLHKPSEIENEKAAHLNAVADPTLDLVAFEKDKIKGAIRTDFILSAEIVVITLGSVSNATLTQQILVLTGIAAIMTVGVYGLVAAIVRMDDVGLRWAQKTNPWRGIGLALISGSPYLMKTLSVVGTAAMFLVGGSILMEGIPAAHHVMESVIPVSGFLHVLGRIVSEGLLGVAVGIVCLLGFTAVTKVISAVKPG